MYQFAINESLVSHSAEGGDGICCPDDNVGILANLERALPVINSQGGRGVERCAIYTLVKRNIRILINVPNALVEAKDTTRDRTVGKTTYVVTIDDLCTAESVLPLGKSACRQAVGDEAELSALQLIYHLKECWVNMKSIYY